LSVLLANISNAHAALAASQKPDIPKQILLLERLSIPLDIGYFDYKDGIEYFDRYYSYGSGDKIIATQSQWSINLKELGINDVVENNDREDCNYTLAIQRLNNLRKQSDIPQNYIQFWAINQNLVLNACAGTYGGSNTTSESVILTQPDYKTFPKRAAVDFLYQQASLLLYQGHEEDALEYYEQILSLPEAKTVTDIYPYAYYMVLRLKSDPSFNKLQIVDEILKDSNLSDIHNIAQNSIFVDLDHKTNNGKILDSLKWLVQVAFENPYPYLSTQQSLASRTDAWIQLGFFMPYYDVESKRVDWWLSNVPLDHSERMQAVRDLAKIDSRVDWLQSAWAFNIFKTDWLWSLHQADNLYWVENKHIVENAITHFRKNDGIEWLQIILQRAHPNDSQIDDFIPLGHYMIKHIQWTDKTTAYYNFVYTIWDNLIRIHLGRGEFEQVLELLSYRKAFYNITPTDKKDYSTFSIYNDLYHQTTDRVFRWLIYTGSIDNAQKLNDFVVKEFSNNYGYDNFNDWENYFRDFTHWRFLLAKDWDEAIKIDPTSSLSQKMINLMPDTEYYRLASKGINADILSRTAFMQALLLQKNPDIIDKYAMLAIKKNPPLRDDILKAIQNHNPLDYYQFMMRYPRMRPVPFADFNWWTESHVSQPKQLGDFTAIDITNPNDNNWWCRYDMDAAKNAVIHSANIALKTDDATEELFEETPLFKAERTEFDQKQKDFLATHPYVQKIDENHLKQLSKIPTAPDYLTHKVLDQESWVNIVFNFFDPSQKSMRAADLHNAIRVTRYGCQANGSHESYSRKAFSILKNRYKGTSWEKATPYWFGCEHFKKGCENSNKPQS
jgi:tetratricopeptide (TPR) repeat protein